MLNSKVTQKVPAIFPEFDVGDLGQVFNQRPGRFDPHGRCTHDGKANGPADPEDELLPCLIIARACAKTDDLLQGQRRIPSWSGSFRHPAVLVRAREAD